MDAKALYKISYSLYVIETKLAEKWSNVPHKIVNGLSVLENATVYLRCKVTNSKEISTHTAFSVRLLMHG